MPVDRWDRGSLSPELRGRSFSPPAEPSVAKPNAGPSTRVKYDADDIQRIRLEKLFANPTKEIALPTGPKERTLRAPREMMKNVQGSSSGAGSGEFHVYKQSRRREYERLKMMEDKNRQIEEQKAFQARQDARDAATEAKTAKNRAKRQKRKQGRKGDDGLTGSAEGGGGGGSKLRKLEHGSGGKVMFKRPGQDSDSDEDGDESGAAANEEEAGPSIDAMAKPEDPAPVPVVVEETKILIHDDD
ncbi:hypothetical protein BD324DRAFT_623595 [Kockovaella imperatae]|uniref:DUF1168 domain protein n=1 Tax=Kockovaella imperatae TaxID=4999 RepID=A0A1Y1U6S3_9TREE|nr:hypothetical protein BD324DRAFT_595969 [Kockovaella imperatae]XP_021871851.1 hypothetical protein BD324DRAFT_623595 [Kockovaella imperatae]ORX33234.1 hypothetical protein BD324DRAFT_595969 [Kockovaella imperatae]ORX37864.1 hypothetical protein BD324DRAFT_623595 [Kockovaella imperatae]